MNYPRLLIISSSAFNQYTGGGVMLTNLFRGWPRERIAVIHGDPVPTDDQVCGRYFSVGPDELRWAGALGWGQRLLSAGNGAVSAPTPGGFRATAETSAVKRFLRQWLGEEMPWNAHLSPALRAFVDDFKPDLIYTLAGGPYMRLVRLVSEWRRIPVAAHMMDDWPAVVGRRGLLGAWVRRRLLADLKRLFKTAALRLTISGAMAAAYEKRYGLPFTPFNNAVDVAGYRATARQSWSAEDKFRLIYIGTILSNNQKQSLIDVANAVGELNAAGEKIEFYIHSAWSEIYRAELETNPFVFTRPPLDDASVFPHLVKADALLIPVNFDEETVTYIRYSMPAKVPLYMASGTPILVYGPRGIASVDYAIEEGWAKVVSERNADVLRSALLQLIRNEDLRRALGQQAQAVVARNHDARQVRLSFQSTLASV